MHAQVAVHPTHRPSPPRPPPGWLRTAVAGKGRGGTSVHDRPKTRLGRSSPPSGARCPGNVGGRHYDRIRSLNWPSAPPTGGGEHGCQPPRPPPPPAAPDPPPPRPPPPPPPPPPPQPPPQTPPPHP